MQEHTVSEPSVAKPTWASPPRQGESTPAGTAEFVICDHTIETVFAIPGTGRLIVRAIGQLDFPVVQAGVMTLALIIVLINFIVDLLYLYLNPQVRIN